MPPTIEVTNEGVYLRSPVGEVRIIGPGWLLGHLGAWQYVPDAALEAAEVHDDRLLLAATDGGLYEYRRPAIAVLRLALVGDHLVVQDP